MKIVKIQEGWWDIIQDGETIATINTFWRYGQSDGKMLYIGDKPIGEVKNQKEAIEKLKKYLDEEKKGLREYEIIAPIVGFVKMTVRAENIEEGFDIVMQEATSDDIEFGIYAKLDEETVNNFFLHEAKRGSLTKFREFEFKEL